MSQNWFWSDPHFGHKNIIGFCNRPYADVQQMNDDLIFKYNSCVQPGDTSWCMGDFAFLPDNKKRDIIKQLNGYKILILGNHDIDHRREEDLWAAVQRYEAMGFDEVYVEGEIEFQGYRLRHHPGYDGRPSICGHVHDYFKSTAVTPPAVHMNRRDLSWKEVCVPTVNVNVGVDVWDYAPVTLTMIKEEFAKYGV